MNFYNINQKNMTLGTMKGILIISLGFATGRIIAHTVLSQNKTPRQEKIDIVIMMLIAILTFARMYNALQDINDLMFMFNMSVALLFTVKKTKKPTDIIESILLYESIGMLIYYIYNQIQ